MKTDIIAAYKDGAFFNCLTYTQEGIALDTLTNETGFVLDEEKLGTDILEQRWWRDAIDGYVVLALYPSGERICSTLVFGGKPDEIIAVT